MSLYQRYRPQSFDDIVGNEDMLPILLADLSKKDKPHAYLLTGPVGCGKTTIGRLISKALGCKERDFTEQNSADYRGIDSVREMLESSRFVPLVGTCRVWLLDECHRLTTDAQSALLKGLEDTPAHVYYILATTDPQKLLETVRSRCSRYEVKPLTDQQMFRLLRHIAKAEEAEVVREAFDQIVTDSQGYPRTALQILDQVIVTPPEKQLEVAKRAAETLSKTIELCRALLNNQGWKKVANILTGLKDEDPEVVRRAVLGYCSAVLLKTDNMVAASVMEQMVESIFYTGWPGLVFNIYSAVKLSRE
jgi:DNA polymerase III gamma/tau subunit